MSSKLKKLYVSLDFARRVLALLSLRIGNTKCYTIGLRKTITRLLNYRTVLEVVRVRRGANSSQMATEAKIPREKPRRIATSLRMIIALTYQRTKFFVLCYAGLKNQQLHNFSSFRVL